MAFNTQQTKRTQAAVVIVLLVLVVILAVAVLSGAFTPKAASTTSTADAGSAQQTTTQEQAQQSAGSSSDANASTGTATDANGNTLSTMDEVNATYGTAERDLQATYDADSSNPVALLNLANGYFDWGVAAMQVSKTDDDSTHVNDLFGKAIDLYDQYLQNNPDSNSVIVDRAIAIFYTGDHKKAISELEQFTASNDSFAQAWANLGMFYETDGQTDNAKAAYQKAVDTATDSSVKAYAQEHLDALNGTDNK